MRPERRIVGPRQPTAPPSGNRGAEGTHSGSAPCASRWPSSTRSSATSTATPAASAALADAGEAGADVTLVPELAIRATPRTSCCGRPSPPPAARRERAAAAVERGLAVIGFPEWDGDCHNAAAIVADGRVVYRKRFLPNYGVFDEARYFRAGDGPMVVEAVGARIGIAICEDIWYPSPVAADLAAGRVDLVCCISASPYHRGKGDRREQMLATRADDCAAALAFCNQVGGQDELVFDGRSALRRGRGLAARAPQFEEHLLVADVDVGLSAPAAPRAARAPPPGARRRRGHADRGDPGRAQRRRPGRRRLGRRRAPRRARGVAGLRTGLRDYVDKNRFPGCSSGCRADRLRADRRPGRGRPRAGAGHGRRDAVLPSPESLAGAAGARRVAGGPPARAADRPGHRGLRRGPGRGVRRP